MRHCECFTGICTSTHLINSSVKRSTAGPVSQLTWTRMIWSIGEDYICKGNQNSVNAKNNVTYDICRNMVQSTLIMETCVSNSCRRQIPFRLVGGNHRVTCKCLTINLAKLHTKGWTQDSDKGFHWQWETIQFTPTIRFGCLTDS